MKEDVHEEWFEDPQVGTLFTQNVVDLFMDCLPPACMRYDCSQLGEAYSHVKSEEGTLKATCLTFKCVGNDTWQFCGNCFCGENEPPQREKKGAELNGEKAESRA